MKKDTSKNFAEKYDALFEKPKVRLLSDKKIKILVLISVISIGVAVSIPFLTAMVTLSTTERILSEGQKKLDKLKAEQPFTEVPIFKENLKVDFPPNYQKVKSYQMTFDGQTLHLGNGYELVVKECQTINNTLSEINLKPTERYDPVENILLFKGITNDYPQLSNGITYQYDYNNPYETDIHMTVRVTGNLLESVDMQRNKEKGSFLELFQEENIADVKTGIVANYSPRDSSDNKGNKIPSGYLYLTKYFLFPDGAGMLLGTSGIYLGHLTFEADVDAPTDENLKEIDNYSKGTLIWLAKHFELKRAEK